MNKTIKQLHDDIFKNHPNKQRDKTLLVRKHYSPYWPAIKAAKEKKYIKEFPTTLDWVLNNKKSKAL